MNLPVLMYHKVSENYSDALTVTTAELERQMLYVLTKGYQCVTTEQVLNFCKTGKPLPLKPILITFDDAHVSFQNLALPILKNAGINKVTLFVATDLIGTNHSDCGEIMSLEQIQNLDFNFVELGLHSHRHQNYKNLSIVDARKDLQEHISFPAKNRISFAPAFAYPYGGFPKNKIAMNYLKELFFENNIQLAFRIGNRINRLSKSTDLFTLNRIDIRGTDSFFKFKMKLKFGKKFSIFDFRFLIDIFKKKFIIRNS